MSLHALANHLQQAGRGNDKVLIHMTPKELSGLQSLAVAHGGSLTTNPETGLPEASFLSSILPTVIGAGLTIASGGALSPLMAAGLVGGGYGLATGSLKKGLMAGLGAYGGAGLGAGLAEAGAETVGSGLGEFGANAGAGTGADYGAWMGTKGGEMAGQQALANAGTNVGMGTTDVVNSVTGGINAAPVSNLAQTQGNVLESIQKMNPVPAADAVQLSAPSQGQLLQNASRAGIDNAGFTAPEVQEAPSWLNAKPTQPPSYWNNVKAGFGKATDSWEGLKSVWDKTPTGTGYGLMATGMGVMEDMQNKGTGAPAPNDAYLRPYDYSVSQDPNAYAPNASTSERMYFNQPRFIARPIEKIAKEGGLMSINKYGIGGAVEQMSAENSVSGNTMYPQSQLQTSMYSNPMVQRPVQNNVITAGLDTPTEPYTGEQRMASGGVATPQSSSEKKYSYDPQTMKFTETTTTTPAAQDNRFGMFTPGYGFTGYGIGMMGGPIAQLLAKQQAAQQAPQPTVTTETSGGIAAPYAPQGQAAGTSDTSMVPNTQIQPLRTPEQQLGLENFYANMNQRLAEQGGYAGYAAGGGISTLGGYSDGGRLLKGPGDGVSDSIPASIGNRQPARLADGEFVVPARIVSELGNGSTEAGARKLYQMMERVQHARRKTVGKNQVAKNNKAEKLMPA